MNRIHVAMTAELADAIKAGWAKADPDALGPTVDYFYDLLQKLPDSPYVLYEYGAELINLALDRLDGEDAQRYQRSLRGYATRLATNGNDPD